MPDAVPEISILMPVCNAAPYLEACIRSVQQQQLVTWELLAVDDFSTDESWQILTDFAAKDQRIRVFRNREKGIIPALCFAFENASGMYITRMDADDLMPSHKLERLLKIAATDVRKVATGYVRYFSETTVSEGYMRYENWLNSVAKENTFNANMYRECVIASPNWMVHRTCFENHIRLDELNYPEDYDLVLKWYQQGYFFEAADHITHLWREHLQRTSRNSDVYQQESFFKLKTNYFTVLETDGEIPLQLIGAGVKGKLVAQFLNENHIPYNWFEYGRLPGNGLVKPVDRLLENQTAVLTNWPTDEKTQREILRFLETKKLQFGKNLWLF